MSLLQGNKGHLCQQSKNKAILGFSFYLISFLLLSLLYPLSCVGVNLQVYLENCLFLGSFQIEQL